jgi:hypothetical protein
VSPRKQSSTSVRYYLWHEGALVRIPNGLHQDLLNGKVTLGAFAGTRQKLIEVLVTALTKTARKVTARGIIYEFDERGFVDLRRLSEAALEGLGREARFDSAITDLQPLLRRKRYRQNYQWTVPFTVFDQIKADAAPGKLEQPKIRSLKIDDRAQES